MPHKNYEDHDPIAALTIMGLLPCSWRPLVVVLVVVILVLVALLMALVVAAVLMVLISGIGIVVSPVIDEHIIHRCVIKLTIRHSNHHFRALDADVQSLAAARHAADIPEDRNSLGYAPPGNMSR